MDPYLRLAIVTLLPAVLALLLTLLEKKTAYGRAPYALRQALTGVLFGVLAIIGTEWGIPMNGAQVNCRDGAVLTAGLMFGSPAGIIAGLIGGTERWIAVNWGVGTFTRTACSISTAIAGIYAATLRRFMFENKKPGWLISFAIGVVMEVFHLTMVFITNMDQPETAMEVVKVCTMPMLISNGLAVMLAAFVLTVCFNRREEKVEEDDSKRARISQTIQRWLLVTVVLAFAATSWFVYGLQNRLAESQETTLLELALDETELDLRDASDANLLKMAEEVAKVATRSDLSSLAYQFGVAEINLVNDQGIITDSTERKFIGFDFSSGEQSREFLCLLDGVEKYVQGYGPITYDPSVQRKYAGIRIKNGFVQIGYDAQQFQRDLSRQMVGLTKNRHVGESGYIFIVDARGNMVSGPRKLEESGVLNAGEIGYSTENASAANTTFSVELLGEKCRVRYRSVEGYYLVSVLPEAEVARTRNVALYVNTFMEILVFAVMFALIYMLIKRVVVDQLNRVNRSLARITGGDLNETVDVRTNAEFSSLSDDINQTVDTLKRYISEAEARIDKELEFARDIQGSALPNVFPAFPKRTDFDIFALTDPAKEVGGDFYDFYMTGTDTLHFLIADVSGKGIPAALFMMRAKTELKSLTETELPISDVFTQGNRALCEGNDAGMFVTAWQGSVNLNTGLVRYANAGHNPPLVKKADAGFEYVKGRPGFVLAGMDGVKYRMQEMQLQPGDIVYLYTDGVTEATDANSELFGEDRLLEAVNSQEYTDMRTLCEHVKNRVDAFVGDAPQFDDITMVAVRYLGPQQELSVTYEQASLSDIPAVTDQVTGVLEKLDCPMKTVTQFSIAIDEVFSNIVNYGYAEKPGPVTVSVLYREGQRRVSLRFMDQGVPYDPLSRDDPDVTLSAEERKIGGLGIFMVKKLMDEVSYSYENGQNVLVITKNV